MSKETLIMEDCDEVNIDQSVPTEQEKGKALMLAKCWNRSWISKLSRKIQGNLNLAKERTL